MVIADWLRNECCCYLHTHGPSARRVTRSPPAVKRFSLLMRRAAVLIMAVRKHPAATLPQGYSLRICPCTHRSNNAVGADETSPEPSGAHYAPEPGFRELGRSADWKSAIPVWKSALRGRVMGRIADSCRTSPVQKKLPAYSAGSPRPRSSQAGHRTGKLARSISHRKRRCDRALVRCAAIGCTSPRDRCGSANRS